MTRILFAAWCVACIDLLGCGDDDEAALVLPVEVVIHGAKGGELVYVDAHEFQDPDAGAPEPWAWQQQTLVDTISPLLLQLPRMLLGRRMKVSVETWSVSAGSRCVTSRGAQSRTIASGVAFSIQLTPEAQPRCDQELLQITIIGEGTIRLTPELKGACTDNGSNRTCSYPRDAQGGRGTRVVVTPVPAKTHYFAGWDGACSAVDACVVKLEDPAALTVHFTPRLCSERFCWENPLPQGNDLHKIWGSSSAGIWAVGARGTILHWDDKTWVGFTAHASGTDADLYGIWGSGPRDIWAAGDRGTLLHFDGNNWSAQPSPTSVNLRRIWGSGPRDVWVVGDKGTLLHGDGSGWKLWSDVNLPTAPLEDVWGAAQDDVWAVGRQGTILHFDGSRWQFVAIAGMDLFGIWGSRRDDVWVVGDKLTRIHYDGSRWTVDTNAPAASERLSDVWGTGPNDVWATAPGLNDASATAPGLFDLLHYDGTEWSLVYAAGQSRLASVFGTAQGGSWAVGTGGAMIRTRNLEGQTVWAGASYGLQQKLVSIWGADASNIWTAGYGGSVLRADGTGTWSRETIEARANLLGIYGGGDDLWAVGDDGTMMRRRISYGDWSRVFVGTASNLNAVVVLGDHVRAVGEGGIYVHFDGQDRTTRRMNAGRTLWSVWAAAPDAVWTVGDGGMIAFLDQQWYVVTSPTPLDLHGVYGTSANDIWAVGQRGIVLHQQKDNLWVPQPVPQTAGKDLFGVYCQGSKVWIAGAEGRVVHFDGMAWAAIPSGTSNSLTAVFGIDDALWVVGDRGTILRQR